MNSREITSDRERVVLECAVSEELRCVERGITNLREQLLPMLRREVREVAQIGADEDTVWLCDVAAGSGQTLIGFLKSGQDLVEDLAAVAQQLSQLCDAAGDPAYRAGESA